MNEMYGNAYYKRVQKICWIQVIFNYLLTIIKFIGGVIGKSSSLINDGINSLGDVVTSQVSLFASKASSKKADKEHQFGHEKIESLVCLIFSTTLICFTIFLIYNSVISLISKEYLENSNENIYIALIFAIIAIIIKGSLFVFTFVSYKKTNSILLKTQSFDHLSDSVSTIISLIAILVMMFSNNPSLNIIDPICSIIIGLLIILGSLKILIENSSLLLDKAPDKKLMNKIKEEILSYEIVKHIDAFRSRMMGNRIFIELEVSCDGNLDLKTIHTAIENIRINILSKHENVKNILIHVNPIDHINESDF